MLCRRVACALIVLASAVPALAQVQPEASSSPALVLNDAFAAPLWRIDVDADENHLVSASPAKAAVVWSLDDVSAPDLLRLPLREEEMQRAHAVAISADGKRVAAAVPPLRDDRGFAKAGTAAIYIMDRASRRIEQTISQDIATRPQAVRFSPDGAFLAAALSDGCGLRVWKTEDWTLASADDEGYAGTGGACCPATPGIDCDPFPDTPGLAWAKSETGDPLIITSGDTGVRLYKLTAGKAERIAAKTPEELGVERPEGVAVSPDGSRLAVADARIRGKSPTVKLQVAVLDLASLTPTSAPLTLPESAVLSPALLDVKATPGADQMALNRVAWVTSETGDTIYAGGLLWCQIADPSLIDGTQEGEGTENCIARWELPPPSGQDAAPVRFVRTGLDRVMDLVPLPKRKAFAYATLQRVGAINLDGTPYTGDSGAEVFAAARAFDFRDRPTDRKTGAMLGFDISPDASTVYLEDYRGTAAAPIALTFNVDQLKLDRADARPANVVAPKRDPLIVDKLANWWNGPKPPVIYGLPIDALAGVRDTYRTVALAPDKRAIVGSATHVRVVGYSSGKAAVLCQLRVSAEAYRAAVSDDGSLAVVGHSDGTLRWYRIDKGGEDGAACRLSQLLAVHIRQTDDGDGGWVWAAWQPATGKFAADPRAKDLVAWQVASADGQIETVRFADLLQHYAPDAIKTSLRQLIAPRPDAIASLEKSIHDAVDPLRIMVLTPDENADIDSETVKFDIKADGGATWPREIYVSTGSGGRAAKLVAGKKLTANEPIAVAAPGIVQMQVELPAAERQQHRNVDVCFSADRRRTCHTVNWAGALQAPPPRRLHAVIVGVSAYKDPAMVLNFAQNDALDLARIFVRDYQSRVVDKSSKIPPDYASVSIDLIVAAGSDVAKGELAELQKSGVVRVHEASISNIASALGKVAQEADENDLTLFYFSGHGLLNPYRDAKGLTALLGPDIDGNYSKESLERDALSSDRLIALMEPIAGEKLVIIDACRTTASISGERAFDPAAVRLEFERNLLTADFFFSAAPGQYSLDQGELAFADTRPKDEQGNGLFTYALLKSLTEPVVAVTSGKPGRIEVYDVDRYMRGFFDGHDAESAATRLIRRLQEQGIAVSLQQPVFVPSRRRSAGATVIRTLDPPP